MTIIEYIHHQHFNMAKTAKQIRTARRYTRTNNSNQPTEDGVNDHKLVRDVLRLRDNLSHVNNQLKRLTQSIDDHVDRFICWSFGLVAAYLIYHHYYRQM